LGGNWKKVQICVVIVWNPAGSERIAGEPKRASACRTDRMNPLRSAGAAIGNVTVRATGVPCADGRAGRVYPPGQAPSQDGGER